MEMKKTLNSILKRNNRVEVDKAWEISKTRRGCIALFTYALAVLFLKIINASDPYLTALIPTGGYVISTLSLPILKSYWTAHIYKK